MSDLSQDDVRKCVRDGVVEALSTLILGHTLDSKAVVDQFTRRMLVGFILSNEKYPAEHEIKSAVYKADLIMEQTK